MYNPRVSIIIPVYNGVNYVGYAIDSALAQTYKNIEIIVVNDGSTDGGDTEKVILSYGDKVRYIKKENGGVSTALNTGIKNMTGEWFSWLSHDDLYEPNKIEVQIADVTKIKEENLDYQKILYYCTAKYINAEGEELHKKSKTIKDGLYKGVDALYKIFQGFSINGCGLLIHKSMFENVSLFDEKMRFMQDVFLWEQAFVSEYSLYINNTSCIQSRIHDKQVSNTGKGFALIDREKVGIYLTKNLKELYNSEGNMLLKQYLYLCMRNNSLNIGNNIYKILKEEKKISLFEKIFMSLVRVYGCIRKIGVKVYYRIKFKARR